MVLDLFLVKNHQIIWRYPTKHWITTILLVSSITNYLDSGYLTVLRCCMGVSRRKQDYVTVKKLEAEDSGGLFKHEVEKVQKIKRKQDFVKDTSVYEEIWFQKYEENYEVALAEVIANELFRLMIPGHPQSQLVLDNEGKTFVTTKGIKGFRSFDEPEFLEDIERLMEDIKNQYYTGAGLTILGAVLMEEIDFKFGNIGINEKNQIIKIDGDWCFSSLRLGGDYPCPITAELLDSFPFLTKNYNPFNFFGIMDEGKIILDPLLVNAYDNLGNSAAFRQEMNAFLLRALVIPAYVFREMMEKCLPDYLTENQRSILLDHVEKVYTVLLTRRGDLEKAAFENKNFRDYLQSPEAQEELENYEAILLSFKLNPDDSDELLIKDKNILHQEIEERLAWLGVLHQGKGKKDVSTLFEEKLPVKGLDAGASGLTKEIINAAASVGKLTLKEIELLFKHYSGEFFISTPPYPVNKMLDKKTSDEERYQLAKIWIAASPNVKQVEDLKGRMEAVRQGPELKA